MTKLRESMPLEKAGQMASGKFGEELMQIFGGAIGARDTRLVELFASSREAEWRDVFRHAQRLGLVHPPWLRVDSKPFFQAVQELAMGMESTQLQRQDTLKQRTVREVVERRELNPVTPTSSLSLPEASRVLSAGDVARLRAGEALVLDVLTTGDAPLVTPAELRAAEADLRRLARRMGVGSKSHCNTGARNCFVPLLGSAAGVNGASGAALDLARATNELLRLLAALPAEIEKHGWARPLSLPTFFQLAVYASETGARYTPHLDRQPHEAHNKREITILFYLNEHWDVTKRGGCLRLHPTLAPTVDVPPLAGRLVIFQAGTMMHEVLPCTEGERIALTLWVEYVE